MTKSGETEKQLKDQVAELNKGNAKAMYLTVVAAKSTEKQNKVTKSKSTLIVLT
jgi:hypothetical protein